MWQRCQRFESFVFERTINSTLVIECFDRVAANLAKQTIIVLDNAPIDRSEEFEEKIEEWEKLALSVYFLPRYCSRFE